MNERVVTELVIDASDAEAGAAAFEASMQRAQRATNSTDATIAAFARRQEESLRIFSRKMPQSLENTTKAFYKVAASVDPVLAAQYRLEQEMTRSMAVIDRSVKLGVTSQVEANAILEGLRERQIRDLKRVREAQISASGVSVHARSNFAAQNVGYQAQDVLTSAIGGMSPMMIGFQQGQQLAGGLAMAEGGAVAALRAGLMSLLSPLNLVAIGGTAAVAAGIQYFTRTKSEIPGADTALAKHAELIGRLKDRYGDALSGLRTYSQESAAVLKADVALAQESYQATIKQSAQDVLQGSLFHPGVLRRPASDFGPGTPLYGDFVKAIDTFEASVKADHPAIAQFVDDMARLRVDPHVTASQKALADEIRNSQSAIDGMKADRAKQVLDSIGDAATTGAGRINEFTRALKAMQDVAKPSLGPLDQLLDDYHRALMNSSSIGERNAADAALIAGRQRLADQAGPYGHGIPTPEFRPNDIDRLDADPFLDIKKNAEERIRQLKTEAAAFGLTGAAAAKYAFEQDLLNQAVARNIELSPDHYAWIEKEAEAFAAVAEPAARSNVANDITFEMETLQ